MENEYSKKGLIAIIGDIVESKKIIATKRGEYQNRLKSTLDEINDIYKDDICSNFVITLGDEFQGVLYSAVHVLDIIERIQFKMDFIKIRFGIGVGLIYTQINKVASIGADGPAYHRARACISYLKKTKEEGYNIYLETGNSIFDLELNSHLYWVCKTFNKWSNLQREIVKIKIDKKDITQTEIAQDLDKDQSLVSRSIKASRFENYIKSKNSISSLIEKLREDI